jgi:DNA-binding LacI/PurR family transcriptional regulator
MEAFTFPNFGRRLVMSAVPREAGPHHRPTLGEVARAAGVSAATVSRVINGSPRVSAAAREAVEGAISALGYVPNRAARSLVTRQTDTIAIVLSEPEERIFADPFFAAMVRGISAAVADTDLQLVLLMIQSPRERAKVERYVTQGHVDGVVLMSLHSGDPLPDLLADAHIPTVLSGRPTGTTGFVSYVDADNRGGGRLAVDHLLSIGRTRIATVTGPMDMAVAVDRFDGYCDALRAAGIRPTKSYVEAGDFTDHGGEHAMATLLRRNPDLDGVFVASDPMAMGALRALDKAGRRVPEDVALVGFDDVPMAGYTHPPLTTVRQPLDQMAAAMAELLMAQLTDESTYDGLDQIICATELVRRDSA